MRSLHNSSYLKVYKQVKAGMPQTIAGLGLRERRQLEADLLLAVEELLQEFAVEEEIRHGAATRIGSSRIQARAGSLYTKLEREVAELSNKPHLMAIRLYTANRDDGHCLQVTQHDAPELCSILSRVISADTPQPMVDAAAAEALRPVLMHAAKFAAIANLFLTSQRRTNTNDSWRQLDWHAAGCEQKQYPRNIWHKLNNAAPSFCSYRGTSIPCEMLELFVVGKQAHAPNAK